MENRPERQAARSETLLNQAQTLIPGLTTSMMKRPEQFGPGVPAYLAEGRGADVADVDGNRYVDFICGLGANALGHRHPAVEEALVSTLRSGVLHSLPTPLEVDASARLVELVPGAQMARFFKTGADATSAAVRLARAITGRPEIVCIGYNGWHDHFMFDTPGVPEALQGLTHRMPLQRQEQEEPLLELIRARDKQLAGVLLSVPYNRELTPDFLQRLREACDETGALLIADDIVTGFRLALGGIQEHFGFSADLSCVSKALAAGMPLSAVVGRRPVMEQMAQLQVSTTFGGEQLSLAACVAALDVYANTNYLQHIASLGRRLKDGVNAVATRLGSSLRVVGYDPIPMFLFDPDPAKHVPKARFFVGAMAERGFLLRRDVNFICNAHTKEQVDALTSATEESLLALAESC